MEAIATVLEKKVLSNARKIKGRQMRDWMAFC
jgi:hypothetical protein